MEEKDTGNSLFHLCDIKESMGLKLILSPIKGRYYVYVFRRVLTHTIRGCSSFWQIFYCVRRLYTHTSICSVERFGKKKSISNATC